MRYILQKSDSDPLWWVATDTQEQLVCRFKEGEFNDTQQFTMLNDVLPSPDIASKLAAASKGIADWLREQHYEILFSSPQLITHFVRKSIGDQVREAREEAGLTLRELGHMVGLAHNHIGRIEAGKYNVTVDTLAVIAEALGVTLEI